MVTFKLCTQPSTAQPLPVCPTSPSTHPPSHILSQPHWVPLHTCCPFTPAHLCWCCPQLHPSPISTWKESISAPISLCLCLPVSLIHTYTHTNQALYYDLRNPHLTLF